MLDIVFSDTYMCHA